MASIRATAPGEEITVHFKGSAQFGNEPHTATGVLVRVDKDTAIVEVEGSQVELYKMPPSRLWRYGTSAEVVTFS